jgi:hypothetical protein
MPSSRARRRSPHGPLNVAPRSPLSTTLTGARVPGGEPGAAPTDSPGGGGRRQDPGGGGRQDPGGGGRQDPGEEAPGRGAGMVRITVDDHAGRRAATNQLTLARTCVLMKKASQRVRKCVLIRSMFQVTCSSRSQLYGTPAVPSGATPLLVGITGDRLSCWRRFGLAFSPTAARRPASAVVRDQAAVAPRHVSEVALPHVFAVAPRHACPVDQHRSAVTAPLRSGAPGRHRSGARGRHRSADVMRRKPGHGPRAGPATIRAAAPTATGRSPRSLRGRGERRDDLRRVTARRRRRSSSIAACALTANQPHRQP